MTHTTKQLNQWREYEEVRQEGMYNMFDQNARLMTEMTRAEWVYCMTHYDTLKAQAEGTRG